MKNAVSELNKSRISTTPMSRNCTLTKLSVKTFPPGKYLFRAGLCGEEKEENFLWFANNEEDCISYKTGKRTGLCYKTNNDIVYLDVIENIDHLERSAPHDIKRILKENYKNNRISELCEDKMAVNWITQYCRESEHPIDAVYYGGVNAGGKKQHHKELFLINPLHFVEFIACFKIERSPPTPKKKAPRGMEDEKEEHPEEAAAAIKKVKKAKNAKNAKKAKGPKRARSPKQAESEKKKRKRNRCLFS